MILKPTTENIRTAAGVLRRGGLVAFPTETVYGLGADARNESAVMKLFEVKGRPASDPLIVHIHSPAQLESVADIERNSSLQRRVELLLPFWPGPLSLVLPRHPSIPPIIASGMKSVAVRIPAHPVAQELLRECGFPVAAPSANPFSYVSPTTAQHVEEQLGGKIDSILDGGTCQVGIESTVLSLVDDSAVILRPGAVTKEQLEEVLGAVELAGSSVKHDKLSPGLLDKHYSPRTRVALRSEVDPSTLRGNVGLITFFETYEDLGYEFHAVHTLSAKGNPAEIAQNLYSALREQDNLGLDIILIDSCPEIGLGRAIMDRVRKAIGR